MFRVPIRLAPRATMTLRREFRLSLRRLLDGVIDAISVTLSKRLFERVYRSQLLIPIEEGETRFVSARKAANQGRDYPILRRIGEPSGPRRGSGSLETGKLFSTTDPLPLRGEPAGVDADLC